MGWDECGMTISIMNVYSVMTISNCILYFPFKSYIRPILDYASPVWSQLPVKELSPNLNECNVATLSASGGWATWAMISVSRHWTFPASSQGELNATSHWHINAYATYCQFLLTLLAFSLCILQLEEMVYTWTITVHARKLLLIVSSAEYRKSGTFYQLLF